VRSSAPDGYEYSLTVASVAVTSDNVDSSNVATSEAGNASMTFEGDLVSVYVTDNSGEPIASTVEYCGPVPRDGTTRDGEGSAAATTQRGASS